MRWELFQVMKYANYPQIQIEMGATQTPQYSLPQTLKTNETPIPQISEITYIQTLINQNQNPQYQNTVNQLILPLQNSVVPYLNSAPYNQTDQNQLLTTYLIKDLNFYEQKRFLIKIIFLFLLWSTLYGILLTFLLNSFANTMSYNDFIYPLMLICFAISMVIVNNVSIEKKYRKSSIVLYFLSILLYTFLYFSFAGAMAFSNEISISFIIAMVAFICQCANIVTTVVMIFYLLLEQKRIIIGKFMGLTLFQMVIIALIFFKKVYLFLLFIPLSIPYAYLLSNSLLQIQRGRFKLEKNQVFAGALAANYGLYTPFAQGE